jgi:hypothetical protein
MLGDAPAQPGAIIAVRCRKSREQRLSQAPAQRRRCNTCLQERYRLAFAAALNMNPRAGNVDQLSRCRESAIVRAAANELDQGHQAQAQNQS